MKRLFALLFAALMILGVLASCGEQPASSGIPSSQSEELTDGEAPAESETDSETEEAEKTEPETEAYIAPEDREFLICGTPLKDYTFYLYFPQIEEYHGLMSMGQKAFFNQLQEATEQVLGISLNYKVLRNERMFPESGKADGPEILLGTGFERPGIPVYDGFEVRYGITEDGTIYFQNPTILLDIYLWKLFLEDVSGVPVDSGKECYGFSAEPFEKTLPRMTDDTLRGLGYEPVFEDNFDGEEVDWDVWKLYPEGPGNSGYGAGSQVSVADGNLIITGEWLEDGAFGQGWYAAGIGIREQFCRGYFECTMKCSVCNGRSVDFWSAFWIVDDSWTIDHVYYSNGGPEGCEMDIVENFGPNYQTSCFWVSDSLDFKGLTNELFEAPVPGVDFSAEYHTYGMIWDEEYYRVYVDGVLFAVSRYARGTSEVPETVWLSLCLPGEIKRGHDEKVEMMVDSVRIWQKPTQE